MPKNVCRTDECCQNMNGWLRSTPMNGKNCSSCGNGPTLRCASRLHSKGQRAQSSSIQSETRTPVSMADVEHMSSEQPFMICLASFVRRYSALVWIQVHPPPGLEASSLGTRSSTTGCHRHSTGIRAAATWH